MLGFIFALFVGFSLGSAVEAAPQNGRVVEGAGSIERSGNHTDIRQQSDFLATSWDNFSIAAHESVQAHQPRSTSRLLIRVDGGGATNIAGSYTSNGITILENRNGVQFSRGAIVNVGGLLATSSHISGADGAHWQLNGTGGAVVNHGQIVAGAGGAILAAVKVQNTGDITAKGGDVALGAGSSFTVDFAGSMVGFEVRQAASGASIANTGKIEAQGGVVALSAQEAQAVRANVVSVGGVVKATRIERRGGVVYLSGGDEGIAEVSGDVSASKKVQTTGEYVVVKEGALLKAPEILVGGDFQGKGKVPTSRRTLVERGALLDAGANGRVIVWSDETTWFNGNITAPDGFAEVSGKETLASVHLAGIDVGELLLDPTDIIIAATGTAVSGNIAADASGGTMTLGVDSINRFTGDLTLAASNTIRVNVAINKPTGRLFLTAGGNLTITADINNGANRLRLAAGEGTGSGDLAACPTCTLTASDLRLRQASTFSGTAPYMIAASVSSLSLTTSSMSTQTVQSWMTEGDRALSLTSSRGTITIAANLSTGSGDITLTGNGGIVLGGDITLTGGAVSITSAINASSNNYNFTITASGALTINSDINLGSGALTLTATGANIVDVDGVVPVLTASTVSLTQAGTFAADLFTIASATSLTLDAGSTDQIVHAWMADGTNRALSLTTTGAITIGRDIATGTSSLTLVGGTLTLTGAARTLSGAEIALTGALTSAGLALTITAVGNITINSNINLGAGALTLTAGMGGGAAGNIVDAAGVVPMLTASTVSLAQDGTFAADLFMVASATSLTLTTAANQTVHGWMVVADRALSLTSGGAITTGNIDTGMGDLTLDGTGIVISGFGITLAGRNVVLTGAISDSRSDITIRITAMEDITINNNITMTGVDTTVTLIAGANGTGNITLTGALTLRANTISLTQDDAFAGPTVLFTITTPTLNLTTAAPQTVHNAWMVAAGRVLSLTSTGGSITVDTAITASGDITLTATTININADIGTSSTPIAGSLTLDGDTLAFSGGARILSGANISLTGAATHADDLTITATGTLTITSNITINGGDLMLTAQGAGGIVIGTATGSPALTWSGGVIALMGDVTTASTAGAANLTDFTITAQGALTVAGIDLSNSDNSAFGNLVLIAGAGTQSGSNITFGGALNAASVELRQDTDFDPANRPVDILIEGTDPRLEDNPVTVVISGDVEVPWARVLITEGSITITDGGTNDPDGAPDNGIVLDTARLVYTGNIMLNAGALDITFTSGVGNTITWQAPNITIIARSIVLGGRTLNITAEGGTLTLNVTSIIATGTGDLAFAGTTINLGSASVGDVDPGTTTLTGSAITLTAANGITVGRFNQRGAFRPATAPALAVNASGALTIAANITSVANITLGSTDGITVTSARTITGRAITLTGDVTASDGLTVNSTGILTFIGDSIATGTGNLSLTGATINLGRTTPGGVVGTVNLTGSAITLTAAGGITVGRFNINGDFRPARAPALAVDASGVLTIAAAITSVAGLTLEGAGAIVATGRPRLTASTVSLAQVDAFPPTRPFRVSPGSSLAITTEAAQDVHDWMILENTDLTVTSSNRVRVVGAIGDSLGGRDLGAGTLTLTSTGANIRIQQNISTTGNITLSGVTDGINFNNGAAKTLSGAAITLTGVVVSNRDLTINASGVLRLNNNITTTASNLVLTGGGEIDLVSALTLSGGDIMLTGAIAENANGLTITADGTLTINSNINTGSGDLTLMSGTIQITRGPDDAVGTTVRTLSGANITLTAANGIEIGRLNRAGTFLVNNSAANFTVTASGMLTIAADITVDSTTTSGGDITLSGGGGGIVIGTTGSSALTWRGSNITLTGAVTTASSAGIDNFTSLILRASENLRVGAIDLANNAGGSADAWGDLRLRAGVSSGIGTITFGGSSSTINAGSIQLEQDEELFAAEPANLLINGVDVGTTNLRFMVLVFYSGSAVQASVDWGTVVGAGAIDLGMGDDLLIGLFNGVLNSRVSITINAGTGAVTFAATAVDITLEAPVITITAGSINANNRNLTITTDGGTLTLNSSIDTGTGNLTLTSGTSQITRGPDDAAGTTVRTLNGANITLTAADGILLGRLNESGIFFVNNGAANFTVMASGVLTIAANITVDSTATSGGDIALTGGSIVTTGERTITGRAITLMGAATGTADLTLTANGTLTLNNNITLAGAGALTLSGAGAIVGGSSTLELTASTVSLTQAEEFAASAVFGFAATSLMLFTDAAQDVHDWMIASGRNLTVESPGRVRVAAIIGTGGVAGRNLGTGDITLTSTGGALRILENISTTGNITLNGGTDGINLNGTATLTGAIITLTGDARSNSALTLTASGTLRINNSITLTGAGALSLSSDTLVRIAAAITTDGDITLSGGTDGINLTGADTLTGAAITLTGDARSNQDLAITASGVLTLNGGIDTGTSALSLMGATISIAGDSSITHTLSGGAITLTGAAMGAANLTITASGTLTLNSDINIGTNALTLTSGVGAIVATGRPRLTADRVSFSQVDALPATRPFRGSPGSSLAITTEAAQDVHDWMILENTDLTVTSASNVIVRSAIGSGNRNLGTGALSLTSTGGAVRIFADITTGGDITLSGVTGGINLNGGVVTFAGAAITLTGDARSDSDLAITASGTLTLNNDIDIGTNALTLTSGVGAIVGTGRPRLTAGMVSLAQVDAFPATRTLRVIPGSSLAITTEAAQDVHDWMILENIDLTVTSSNRVRVVAIIGTGGVAGRNLGTGSITLTSTGGAVRILANISTTGDLTLSGVTNGINLNGTDTFSGADITLTGNARSDRDLILNAMSGALTLNGDINTGTSALSLSGSGGITLGSALTLTGGRITLSDGVTGTANLTITASGILTINNDIALTGAGLTLALSSAGAIDNGGTVTPLTASTVRLRQVAAFGDMQQFTFGVGLVALELTTTANQDVHDWMIVANRNLTVTSAGNVIVRSAIGAGETDRNLGDGNITLRSTGGVVSILTNITTTGDLTLDAFRLVDVRTGTPALTASTVSLAQADMFGSASPFNFSTTGSLVLITEAAQDVHDWMIEPDRNLTVTSASNVIVRSAIGAGVANRDLGTGSITLRSTGGAVRIFAGISTTGNITLSGATGINFNNGAATKTLSGAAITLTGDARSNRALTINASGTLRINNNITLTGTGALTLSSDTVVRILAGDISAGGNITLGGGTNGINFNSGAAAKTLSGAAITLTGDARSNQDLTLIASGTLTLNGGINTGTGALSLSGSSVALGSALTLSGGNIMLTGAIAETANGLTITATGTLTINSESIATGTGDLTLTGATINLGRTTPGGVVGTVNLTGSAITLTAAGGITVGRFNINGDFLPARAPALAVDASGVLTINAAITSVAGLTLQGAGAIVATGRPRLTASTVSLAQIDAFAADANGRGLFRLTAGSLVITTEAAQDVHNWMIADGRNLTLTSPARVNMAIAIGAGVPGRNIGAGTLTLTSMEADIRIEADITTTGNITLNGSTGINLSGDARTISGVAITLTGNAAGAANLTITASGTLTINNDIDIGTNALTLTSGAGAIVGAGRPRLTASTVSLAQDAAFPATRSFRLSAGSLAITTEAAQDVHDWMILENTDLTVTSASNVIVRSAIDLGDGSLTLTSTGAAVRIFVGITTTGNITLSGVTGGINFNNGEAAKTLAGAIITLTGDARSNRDLALTASGTLTLNNDIDIGTNALTLASGVGAIVATGRPRLTAGMVSFSQVDALPATRPFRFIPGSSLAITTEEAQDVHDWMILENIDLTVTSSNRVRVVAIIGTGGVAGRNLGTGALSLTSTGGAVRILANISTTGDLTLSGGTGGINLNGTDTLSGAIITLTGDARGNRDLTITASGVLTINNNINIGTTGTTLTLTGASLTFGSSVALTAGAYSFTPDLTCNTGTTPSCTTITP